MDIASDSLQGARPNALSIIRTLTFLSFATQVVTFDLEHIAAPVDFLGLNYYVHEVVKFERTIPIIHARRMAPLGPLTTIGSGLRPGGLKEIRLKPGRDYGSKLPIFITQVGYLFNDYGNPEGRVNDSARIKHYDEAFRAAARAKQKGVDQRGIFV